MTRLLLADDHQILLDGFVSILQDVDDMHVVATASNGKSVLDLLEEHAVDVVLLDINMPEMNGVETCKKITNKYPETKVIALSMHKRPSFIKRMMQYGARGYILKDDDSAEIIKGIRQVVSGKKYFSLRVQDLVLEMNLEKRKSEGTEISEREVEVLRLISQGLTNQEIAEKLFLSFHTADSHRRNLVEKLGARNTADLVRIGLERGYI
jgi:DNA-binding NarL/FixJ family response regulator